MDNKHHVKELRDTKKKNGVAVERSSPQGQSRVTVGARLTAQWAKCLLCNHEDPSSEPWHLCIKPGLTICVYHKCVCANKLTHVHAHIHMHTHKIIHTNSGFLLDTHSCSRDVPLDAQFRIMIQCEKS